MNYENEKHGFELWTKQEVFSIRFLMRQSFVIWAMNLSDECWVVNFEFWDSFKCTKGPFRYSWKLKTETEIEKHCSKIIFKCVNSTVGPIFNEKVVEKWNLWVREQCTQCTVHRKSQIFQLKKKKKKQKRKTCVWEAQTRFPNAPLVSV